MRRRSVSILFEQYSRERRLSATLLFAESTFDVDNALKNWLEKSGPDKIRRRRSCVRLGRFAWYTRLTKPASEARDGLGRPR